MRARPVALLVVLLAAGCSSGPPPAPDGTAQPVATGPLTAQVRLAGLAAAAKDRRFAAGYAFTQAGRPPRTVTVVLAADGTWRVDVPGGALGGQADIAVANERDGLYQCQLGTSAVLATGCVRVGSALSAAVDPRVQHPFTDWLDVLTDRQAALSVAPAPAVGAARGTCFSVEPTAAALVAPIDAGVYCFDTDGTLTAARWALGTLVLSTGVSPAPPTAVLPGPIVPGAPLPTAAPPSPSASPSPSKR